MKSLSLAFCFVAFLGSCRDESDSNSPLPRDIEAAWRKIEKELESNVAIYSITDSFNGDYVSEFEFKKIGEKWLMRCIRDGSNTSGVFTGKIQVRTPEEVFSVKDNSALTSSGNPYSLNYTARPGDPLTDVQIGLLTRAQVALFAPISCERLSIDQLKKARDIDKKENSSPEHPEWVELTLKDFSERLTPWGRDEDPIVATGGKIEVDSANGHRMVSRQWDINWNLQGKMTENIRKQRIEYLDGLDHFVIYGEWEGPVSNNMVQKTEIKRVPGVPAPEEFTLAHYGISYSAAAKQISWLLPVIVGLGLLLIAAGIYYRRRSNARS